MTVYVAQGWRGYAGWGDQAALGDEVDPTRFNAVESISANEKRGSQALKECRQERQVVARSRGNITADVSVSGNMYPDDYFSGRIWDNILPVNTETGDTTDGYVHEFVEDNDITKYKQFGESIHCHLGGQDKNTLKIAVGSILKSFSLNSPESGALKCSASYIAQKIVNAPSALTPVTASYSALSPFESWMCTVKIGTTIALAAAIDVKDWTFSVEMNPKLIFQQKGATNGRYATKIVFGQPIFSLTFNKLVEDDFNTLYSDFSSDALKSVVLNIKHDSKSGSAAGSEHEITINLPRMMIDEETSSLNGTDDQTRSLKLTALKGLATTTYACAVTIKNSTDNVY